MYIYLYVLYVCVCVYSYFILYNAEILLLFYKIGKSVASSCLPVRGTPSLADRRFSQASELHHRRYSAVLALLFPGCVGCPQACQYIATSIRCSFCSSTYNGKYFSNNFHIVVVLILYKNIH